MGTTANATVRGALALALGSALIGCLFTLQDPVTNSLPSSEAGANPVPDAATSDAQAKLDAPSGASPCSSPHLFCDDFDIGALGQTWTLGPDRGAGTSLDLDPFAVSSPQSMRARLPAGGGTLKTFVEQKVPITDQGLRVEADIFVVDGGVTDNYNIILITFDQGESAGQDASASLLLTNDSARIGIQAKTPVFKGFTGAKLPLDQFVHIVFDVRPNAANGDAVVWMRPVNGGTLTELVRADSPLAYTVTTSGAARTARVQVGAQRFDGQTTSAVDVRFDNFTIDVRP